MADVIELDALRQIPGTAWISWCGQCIACGYQYLRVDPIPDWAEAAPTPDCHECMAERSVLPRRDLPESFNDGSADPWSAP